MRQSIRLQVLKRDNYTCQICPNKAQHVHHIIPRRKISLDLPNNLTSLCKQCHRLLELKRFYKHQIKKYKMVKLKDDTHKKLLSVGEYRETISDIISKCVKCYKEEHKFC